MARWTIAPDPRLAAFVECIAFSIDEPGCEASSVRVIPDGRTDLLFSIPCDPQAVAFADTEGSEESRERPCTGEVYGIKTGPLLISNSARVENIAVCFKPGAAKRFFRLPAHELTDRAHGIHEVWGAAGRELSARIAACAHATERKAAIERELLRQLDAEDARSTARAIAAREISQSAVRAIMNSGGRVSVESLSRETACSERRLERIFKEWIGVGPKRLSRIVRFHSSSEALRQGRLQLDVALASGYADQSHLLRDFRAFSGTTPRDLFGGAPDA